MTSCQEAEKIKLGQQMNQKLLVFTFIRSSALKLNEKDYQERPLLKGGVFS